MEVKAKCNRLSVEGGPQHRASLQRLREMCLDLLFVHFCLLVFKEIPVKTQVEHELREQRISAYD